MTDQRRRRLHSLTGVVPLGVYVALHLGETAAAPGGRRRFAEALWGAGGGAAALWLETLLILVPLGAHAALGLWATAREPAAPGAGYGHRSFRLAQRATGIGLALFLAVHLAQTWVAKVGGLDGAGLYDALRSSAGQPLSLLVWVIGITCLAFHVAIGLAAFASTWGLVRTDAGRRAARGVGVALGLAVWLVSLNTVSHFAVGRAVLGSQHPRGVPEAAP